MFNGISYFQILTWLAQITHEAWSTFTEAQLQESAPLSDPHMCHPWPLAQGFTCSGYDYLKEPHYVYRPKPKKKKVMLHHGWLFWMHQESQMSLQLGMS